MTTIKWDARELAKIEKDAYAILRGKTQSKKSRKFKRPETERDKERRRASKRYATKVKKYKERVGRKRLRKEEKEALHDFTPAQVQRHFETGTEEKWARREKIFTKKYGKNFERKYGDNEEVKAIKRRLLEYVGPKAAARILDIEPDEEPRGIPEPPGEPEPPVDEWEVFSEVDLSEIYTSWDDLPSRFKDPDGNGERNKWFNYQYDHQDLFWTGDTFSLQELIDEDDDEGHAKFFAEFMKDISNDVLFDPPKPSGNPPLFFVYASEWNEVRELADDYKESRKYKPRR